MRKPSAWRHWLIVAACHAALAAGMVFYLLASDPNLFPENEAAPGWHWFVIAFGTVIAIPLAAVLILPLALRSLWASRRKLILVLTLGTTALVWCAAAYLKRNSSPTPAAFFTRMLGEQLPEQAKHVRVRGPGFGKGTTLYYFECPRPALMNLIRELGATEMTQEQVDAACLNVAIPGNWPADSDGWARKRYFHKPATQNQDARMVLFNDLGDDVYVEASPFASAAPAP